MVHNLDMVYIGLIPPSLYELIGQLIHVFVLHIHLYVLLHFAC